MADPTACVISMPPKYQHVVSSLGVKNGMDRGQRGVINRIILQNGYIVLLWRIDST